MQVKPPAGPTWSVTDDDRRRQQQTPATVTSLPPPILCVGGPVQHTTNEEEVRPGQMQAPDCTTSMFKSSILQRPMSLCDVSHEYVAKATTSVPFTTIQQQQHSLASLQLYCHTTQQIRQHSAQQLQSYGILDHQMAWQ